MNYYYLNKNKQPISAGGNYELHKSTCPYYYNYKDGNNFIYIGYFGSDINALNACKQRFPSNAYEIDGCAYCCPSIHKK
jgi:hypothetical protein